ncbi:glutamine synthetase family protein [Aspergillus stella-maris]|uniref:glutamine synthetase family protein n=1 Tax=Aspergillus stella-maris TaxID=1810926 RepID=UPI003CCE02C8
MGSLGNIAHQGDDLNIQPTIENIAEFLKNVVLVQVAGVDGDGQFRGKIISKEKFLSVVESGFGMSSALFGWDMHDELFDESTSTNETSSNVGYADFTAIPDLSSMRRLPWADNIPFFLLRFVENGKPVSACGRSMIHRLTGDMAAQGFKALAGVELEFLNYQTPSEEGYQDADSRRNLAAFLRNNPPSALRPLTDGMFGYSITRPLVTKDFFLDVINSSIGFGCQLESWHTESGPGVFEGALQVCDFAQMADRVSLFKLLVRSLGTSHGITPCFMAKPVSGLPGNSGHIHLSLTDTSGSNMFAREDPDPNAPWPDVAHLSDTGRHFLAGLLDALPDLMPLLAPTINSYKRLVENYWAPVHLSWGFEDRLSSIRLIASPTCKPSATRFEIRIPGADLHPHYALHALVAAGLHGVQKNLELTLPPSSARTPDDPPLERLPNTLEEAVRRFSAPGSKAREIFDDKFVDFVTSSKAHELRLHREAVTDWEFKRYIEIV